LTADKIKAKVQLASRAPFALGFMLFLQPSPLAEELQARAVNDQLRALGAVLTDKLGPLPLRDRVDKSGTAISTPSSPAMERIKPWVLRRGCLNIVPKVRQSSIAKSE
jgi:hypothetical protein